MKLEKGKYYRSKTTKRGQAWCFNGGMDFMLDQKPRKCLDGSGTFDSSGSWDWFDDLEEYKIQVGDTLRRIEGEWNGIFKGETFVVTSITDDGSPSNNEYGGHKLDRVELVSVGAETMTGTITMKDISEAASFAGTMTSDHFDGGYSYLPKYRPGLIGYTMDHVIMDDIINDGVSRMELKNMNKTNLKLAKAKFTEEKNNAEVEYAKDRYRFATDEIAALDRQIKECEENKKPYLEVLKAFK